MPRRKSNPELGADLLEAAADTQRQDDFIGVLEEEPEERQAAAGLVLPSKDGALEEPMEDELDEVAQEEKAEEEEEEAEEETEKEWEPETLEVLDDPVRMYLREIGRVRLLTSADECLLARRLEAGKHLQNIEKELTDREGRPPQSWEIAQAFLGRVADAAPLAEALGEHLGLPEGLTLSQVCEDPVLRKAIDGPVSQDMMAALALILEEPVEKLYPALVRLSLDSWLAPPRTLDVVGNYPLSQLNDALEQAGCQTELQRLNADFGAHCAHARVDFSGSAAELALQVVAAVHTGLGQVGIELVRVPGHLWRFGIRVTLGVEFERVRELPLADEAPRADDIRNHIDLKRHSNLLRLKA